MTMVRARRKGKFKYPSQVIEDAGAKCDSSLILSAVARAVRAACPVLFQLEVDAVAFEGAAFFGGEIGEGYVVIRQRTDLLRAGRREVVLKLQHGEGGAFADGIFLLLGVQRGFGIDARLFRGFHALISRLR